MKSDAFPSLHAPFLSTRDCYQLVIALWSERPGELNPIRQQRPCGGLVIEPTCSFIRCCSATDHRQFRQSRDATAPAAIRHCLFFIRKTFNQRSLWFRAPTRSLGDCIAWYGCADDFGLQLRLLSPTAGSPEVLVGMLDEDRRDN